MLSFKNPNIQNKPKSHAELDIFLFYYGIAKTRSSSKLTI